MTVREFLSWFGVQRRGVWVLAEIQDQLKSAGLVTEPDFESTYIDGPIEFRIIEPPANQRPTEITGSLAETLDDATLTATGTATVSTSATATAVVSYSEPLDPTHKISKLPAANNPPVSVKPEAPVREAITLMLAKGFSQLPVMTSVREVKGVVSWQSIGARLGSGLTGGVVKEIMEQHYEVRHDVSIFHVIPIIVANDYVLVRGRDNTIVGIVTASDLSLQFLQLSEPFLLLSEIENQIRQLISKRFSPAVLATCRDPLDANRVVERASDLTFGEYIRLLENPDHWTTFALPLDRQVFCKQLVGVRDIRNDVMHFDPDG